MHFFFFNKYNTTENIMYTLRNNVIKKDSYVHLAVREAVDELAPDKVSASQLHRHLLRHLWDGHHDGSLPNSNM